MRKLVTIRKISDILPIENADTIERAIVDGWQVVVLKNQFEKNDECVYFEIDSFLPDGDFRWQFLVDKQPRKQNGKIGHVLRTVRLRGAISQGFILPLHNFPEIRSKIPISGWNPLAMSDEEYSQRILDDKKYIASIDFAECLGVEKWDPPIPPELAGQVKGNFPEFISKTDQERIQNLPDIFSEPPNIYEVTIKLDGTSMTAYHYDGEVGVCSRNLELKLSEENKDNTFVKLATETGLFQALKDSKMNVAVQGELMGPGIQKNREKLIKHSLFIFDVYDIDKRSYMTPEERVQFCHVHFRHLLRVGINHVPILDANFLFENQTLDKILKMAEGPSLYNIPREGIVFKRIDGQFSFKAINNNFLLKQKD